MQYSTVQAHEGGGGPSKKRPAGGKVSKQCLLLYFCWGQALLYCCLLPTPVQPMYAPVIWFSDVGLQAIIITQSESILAEGLTPPGTSCINKSMCLQPCTSCTCLTVCQPLSACVPLPSTARSSSLELGRVAARCQAQCMYLSYT